MKVLVAAEDSGSLKEILFEKDTDTSVQTAPQPISTETYCEEGRQRAIVSFSLLSLASTSSLIAAVRKDGSVQLYDRDKQYEAIAEWKEGLSDSKEDQMVGLEVLSARDEFKYQLVTCSKNGKVVFYDIESKSTLTKQVRGPISAFKAFQESEKTVFAFGGQKRDLELISFSEETSKVIWKAKNVKNNKLDLEVPVWITGISFIQSYPAGYELATVTRYGDLRIYDTGKKARPLHDIKLTEHPINAVTAPVLSDSSLIYSDNQTTTALYNYRKLRSPGKFSGATGAVQAMHVLQDKEFQLLATGGLDRYLRVFDINTRKQLGKIFIGTQISSVWILEGIEPSKKREADDIGEASDDELWDKLDGLAKPKQKKPK